MKFLKRQIPSFPRKRPYFPIISILAAVLTLLILLGISTYRHFNQGQIRMEESLSRDGQIILKSLEVSFHTGMMGMMGRTDNLQEIMRSVATLSDIRFVALLDRQGIILAHNDERLVGTHFSEKEKLVPLSGLKGLKSWFGRKGEFIVIKKMEPFPLEGMGEGMRFRMHAMMGSEGTLLDQVYAGKVYAVVGLDTKAFEEARASDLRHALLMGLILLVLGTAGFYFIFLVQNYYLTQKALNSMTLYMNHVVENMPEGLLSLDEEGNIVTWNNRAKELLAFMSEGADKTNLNKKLPHILEPVLDSLKKKSPVLEYEMEFPALQGKPFPLSVSGAKVITETGEDQGAVIILRDLREIKELQEKIKRSERLASLGTLAAGMAHEIRNPLSSIKGFAQYFLKKNPSGSEGQKYSEVIIQEVERLNRVISNLLDFARPKEPIKTLVSIEGIIEHSLELLKDTARSKGIQVIKEIEEDLPSLWLDKDQITQVLLNLILNGLEALEKGGTLWIRALKDQGRKVLMIEIADNGPGLSEEELSKIFDPFYTTKKTGTGLGLAIAYRIIENHQGILTVQSKPGAGSAFQIALPLERKEDIG